MYSYLNVPQHQVFRVWGQNGYRVEGHEGLEWGVVELLGVRLEGIMLVWKCKLWMESTANDHL